MENNKIQSIRLNETVQEFFGIKNDKCPICDEQIVGAPILRYEGKGYHLNCATNFINNWGSKQ